MFSFDENYFLFDVTSVENTFITDLLPDARGEYVKVYLYGLMLCYHPEIGQGTDRISHDLGMTEDEVNKAFRYWERYGAVRRVSDNPPAWKYRNLKLNNLKKEEISDPGYERFARSLYEVFDNGRHLHGQEIMTCYEWVEELKLPEEVVIMLLKHMEHVKGKQFSIQSADRIAAKMADEKISTVEEAEDFLSRDRQSYDGVKKVLRKLGKRPMPSEAQVSMYVKWRDEWGFTPEAIEAACDKTARGDPSMGYLDGILNRIKSAFPAEPAITKEMMDRNDEEETRLRKLFGILGKGNVNDISRSIVREIYAIYPEEVILIGARECAMTGRGLNELKKLLESWNDRGLKDRAAVENYVGEFHRQNDIIRGLREIWNSDEPRMGDASRKLISKWTDELGFGSEMILKAAEYAAGAKKPMPYLDRILTGFTQQNVKTPEEAEEIHSKFIAERAAGAGKASREGAGPKKVDAQMYEQRDYSDKDRKMMDIFWKLSGGDTDEE